jgi:hypothetical protein
MKKRIIQLMLCASIHMNVFGQDCPPQNTGLDDNEYEDLVEDYCENGNGISTDPNNLANPACPHLENDFEWRIKQDPSIVTPDPEFYIVYDEHGDPKSVRNPFNDPGNHEYDFIDDNHNSNYHPEDGWELLKVDFGAQSNFNTGWTQLPQDRPGLNPQQGGAKLPYMILYNKYSGTFRFFGTLLGQMQGYETVRIELRIPERSPNLSAPNQYNVDLKATNLLSVQGDAMQPLDQETTENVMVVFAKATNTESKFFWFDIPTAYDPCLCNIKSQLDITFSFVATANINLNGTIDGALKTDPKNDGSGGNKAVKVATTVIAAGVSTALAVKTGGAVINFQAYANLIKLFKDIPGLSTEDKDNIEKLANYADCASKYAKVIKKDYKDVTASGNLTAAQKKAKYKAANNILDANTTFMSSLANGCVKNKADNGGTTINATANLSGTWTEEVIPGHTEILLAMPGSNWTDFEMDREPVTQNSKTVPAYPEYNERLGTFALLEAPKTTINYHTLEGHQRTIYAIKPDPNNNELKYTFNPLMNMNEEKTEIFFRYVVKDKRGLLVDLNTIHYDHLQLSSSLKNNNLVYIPGSLYPVASPFLPLEYYSEYEGLIFIVDESDSISTSIDSIFIQLKIVMVSDDLGKNGEEIQSVYSMTFPLGVLENEIQFPDPSLAVSRGVPWYENEVNWTKQEIVQQFTAFTSSFFSSGKVFDSDIVYQEDDILIYDGLVEINAKLSTAPGKKVTIYSSVGFELSPGAEVSPDIELILGYPFESNPIPPQTFNQVNAFCQDNNKYKAQTFSAAALLEERRTYEERYKAEQERIAKLKAKPLSIGLYPNPTRDEFTLDFEYALESISVSITDLNGKIISTQLFNGNHKQIQMNATDLKPGVYFVEITTLSGKLGRERLVKY